MGSDSRSAQVHAPAGGSGQAQARGGGEQAMSVDLLPPPGEFRTSDEVREGQCAEKVARWRELLWRWSAAVVLGVFLAAAKLLSAVVLNMAGSSAYEKQYYVTAADRFATLEFFNVVQPWKAP